MRDPSVVAHHGGDGGGGGGGFRGGFGGRRPSGRDRGRDSDDDGPRGPRGPGPDPGPHPPDPGRPPDPGPPDSDDVTQKPIRVVRPADMLVVDITLLNLRLDGHRLVPRDPGAAAFLLATLPPQHVVEQYFPVGSSAPTDPVAAFASGPTTLAFSAPTDPEGLDLSLEALLDWGRRLVPLKVPDGLQAPDTAGSVIFRGVPGSVLEFPTRLLLTYDEPVGWSVRPQPHQADGRTALWHARLFAARGGDVRLRAFSAVRDRSPNLGDDGPLTSLNREDLVTLTSRARPTPPGGTPTEAPNAPLQSEQFIVTPLGASAHLHGVWKAPLKDDGTPQPGPFPALEAYDHITGLGRDQYIRVVTRGRLCTGHLASHVTEFRRVFAASQHDGIVAYLRREDRIIVKQPEVQYDQEKRYTFAGREMPFSSLRITDRVTPLIKQPDVRSDPGDRTTPIRDHTAFWVQLAADGKDFLFTVIGTDCENRQVGFQMPLVFVPDGQLLTRAPDNSLQPCDTETLLGSLYLKDPDRRTCELRGQVMAMAQPPGGAPGSTSHAVGRLTFGLGTFVRATDVQQDSGRCVVGMPYVQRAQVRVEAVEQFTGKTGDVGVVPNETYLEQGMAAHPAGAYLTLQQPVTLAIGAEKAGGLAGPKTVLELITAQAGVIPDAFKRDPTTKAVVAALDLDAMKKAFAGANLLGMIPLDRFLRDIPADHHGTLQQLDDKQIDDILGDVKGVLPAPVLRVRDLADGPGKELRYVWKTTLGGVDGSNEAEQKGPSPFPVKLNDATLTLDARTVRSPDAVDQATVRGSLTDFALDFFEIAEVHIDELKFASGPGKKPDVTAGGVELKFRGALEFVNTLRSALPADVFGAGAYVDVDGTSIRAGYKFAVPALEIGVFTLSNVSLAAELTIPFDGPVSFRFSVAEPEHPFRVTVSLLGGGGFFSLRVDTRGVQEIDAAIEFGGAAALDIGVARGGVSIMAGIRFTLQKGAQDRIVFSGHLRCSGFLCVLGIVTVSVEFNLELTYVKQGRQSVVTGRGTLTVSVRIAFFSKSVSLDLERSFSGAPCDPSFADCVPLEPHWRDFCKAYAPQPHG
ncbi:hypothetical protein [Streptomyces collinus]|uniref:hypothetical protein n=1 Tax=Streptomyces collinus TaxID=42684 RepID=UPI00187338BE|nr:hypothetical protein [Streptomyces collinus]